MQNPMSDIRPQQLPRACPDTRVPSRNTHVLVFPGVRRGWGWTLGHGRAHTLRTVCTEGAWQDRAVCISGACRRKTRTGSSWGGAFARSRYRPMDRLRRSPSCTRRKASATSRSFPMPPISRLMADFGGMMVWFVKCNKYKCRGGGGGQRLSPQLSQTFCERRLEPVSALDKLFSSSCGLHVLICC